MSNHFAHIVTLTLENDLPMSNKTFDIYECLLKHDTLKAIGTDLSSVDVSAIRLMRIDGLHVKYEHVKVFKEISEVDYQRTMSVIFQQSIYDIEKLNLGIEEFKGKTIILAPNESLNISFFVTTKTASELIKDEPDNNNVPDSSELKSNTRTNIDATLYLQTMNYQINAKPSYLVGDIKYTTHAETVMKLGQHSKSPEFTEKLQQLMLEYGVVKIDVAIDPYKF